MGATSTTDLEPLSDHGAPPQVRRIAAAHVAPPRASRHFSARQTRVNVAFLNPPSHMYVCMYSATELKGTKTPTDILWAL